MISKLCVAIALIRNRFLVINSAIASTHRTHDHSAACSLMRMNFRHQRDNIAAHVGKHILTDLMNFFYDWISPNDGLLAIATALRVV